MRRMASACSHPHDRMTVTEVFDSSKHHVDNMHTTCLRPLLSSISRHLCAAEHHCRWEGGQGVLLLCFFYLPAAAALRSCAPRKIGKLAIALHRDTRAVACQES